jgi:hypothetical protein
MSTRTMALVWPLQMPFSAKSVLVSLADNANDAGECWPSIQTISERTCLGRTAVISAVKWLEEKSALRVERGASRSNRYVLTPALFTGEVSGDHHYVYCITHKPTGLFYIGVRSSHCPPEKDDYYGSGKACAWLESVKHECNRAIVARFEERSIAATYETELLHKHIDDSLCLNRQVSSPGSALGNPPALLLDGSPDERSVSRTVRNPDGMSDGPNQSASRTQSVRQADPNRKEPKEKKKQEAPKFDFSSWPSQPSPQVLADWLTLRKRKRADVSETVIRQMAKQLVKAKDAGWTVDDALAECVMRGWQGFNAEWLGAKTSNTTDKPPSRSAPSATDVEYLMAVGK